MSLKESMRFLRESLATFVIILALVVGFAHWMVVPQGRAWKEAEARANALAAQESQTLDVSSITSRSNEIRERIRQITETSERSSDSARLYELLLNLGAKAGIEMGRIIPDSNPSETELVRGLSFQIAASGSFESVVEFTRLLDEEDVFNRIEKMEVNPRMSDGGEEMTALVMRIQFLDFNVNAPLRELAKGDS